MSVSCERNFPFIIVHAIHLHKSSTGVIVPCRKWTAKPVIYSGCACSLTGNGLYCNSTQPDVVTSHDIFICLFFLLFHLKAYPILFSFFQMEFADFCQINFNGCEVFVFTIFASATLTDIPFYYNRARRRRRADIMFFPHKWPKLTLKRTPPNGLVAIVFAATTFCTMPT